MSKEEKKPKQNVLKSNLNMAKTFLMQKVGAAKGTEIPPDYTELRESFVRTENYLGKASKMVRSYCQASEKTTKQHNDVGDYFVEVGLKEKGDISEAFIKIGEAMKTISTMHHSMLVNCVEKYIRPSMDFEDKFSKGNKLHGKFQKKLLAYDTQKTTVENTKDPAKQETESQFLAKIEEEKNTAYTESEFEMSSIIQQRDTAHLSAMIEYFMAYHYLFAEGYTFTSDLLPYMEKLKGKIGSEKSKKIEKKQLSSAPVASSSSSASVGVAASAGGAAAASKGNDADLLEKLKKMAAEEKAAKSGAAKTTPASSTPAPSGGESFIGTTKALYDYSAQEPGELNLKEGDNINVVSQDGDWWLGVCKGQRGYFPSNYVDKLTSTGGGAAKASGGGGAKGGGGDLKTLLETEALYDYDAAEAGEISLKEGDKIKVYKKEEGGWWVGETLREKKVGVFPANYTKAGQ